MGMTYTLEIQLCACGCGRPVELSSKNRPERNLSQGAPNKCLKGHKPAIPIEQRFWAKVDKREADECWQWTGEINGNGYGVFSIHRGDRIPAHRMAYNLTYDEPIPNGLLGCHKCDNRWCCNPAHVFPGTIADNIHDMVSKGRQLKGEARSQVASHGENHYNHKISTDDLMEARAIYALGKTSFADLARRYGMSRPGIRSAILGISRRRG